MGACQSCHLLKNPRQLPALLEAPAHLEQDLLGLTMVKLGWSYQPVAGAGDPAGRGESGAEDDIPGKNRSERPRIIAIRDLKRKQGFLYMIIMLGWVAVSSSAPPASLL